MVCLPFLAKGKIMSNPTLKILPALMIAITAALVTQPMRATAINDLVITENSSMSLTATLNLNPLNVTFNSADNWSIALAGVSGPGGVDTSSNWSEPDAAGFVNTVEFNSLAPNQLLVLSDFGPLRSGIADGTPDTSSFTLNGGALTVTFFDKGDVAAVPDTGTTFSLLGLSLMGLGFLRRKILA
jgi:VPDSG-CTERM motif